ncbi:glycerol kinase [Saccharomycopsis crataegensis]|uniref:glycerol kinase n=1 Tax=Saccharomycopsis crataegensis TaxID=43959 RepID=A0AAV5QQ15_9ASCO|nr:glycerol kinase [Saccharomycopsis crataegensis]
MSTIPTILTIDVGTTSTRAIIFNKDGTEFAKHQIEYRTSANSTALDKNMPIFSHEGIAITETDDLEFERPKDNPITLIFPNPGWVECNPVNILANCLICVAACLVKLAKRNKQNAARGEPTHEIKTIGIANMRETSILWSKKTGLPLYNGIVWNDTRTSGIVDDVGASHTKEELEDARNKCGLPPATYFSASKIKWLVENNEEIKLLYENPTNDDCLMFGTVDTWLVYNLTRERSYITDITNASRTGLMNLDTKHYDESLFKLWGIDSSRIMFPEIRSSSEFFGTFKIPNLKKFNFNTRLTETAFNDLKKYLKGVSISGILGDQSSSMVGQLVLQRGSAKCTYGTGAFLLYNTGNKKMISSHGTLTTFAYWFANLKGSEGEPCYALEGSIAVAGSIVNYLRDNLKFIDAAADVGPLATRVPDSSGVVFVPAFSGLYSPYWIQTRGNIFGLTQFTNSSHIARAAIEGVCFQVKAILQAMAEDAVDDQDDDRSIEEEMKDLTMTTVTPISDDPEETALPLKNLSVDGGMSNSKEVMQIQADILGPSVTINQAISAECTAFGAAIAAGFGFADEDERIWRNFDDLTNTIATGMSATDKLVSYKCEEAFESRKKKWRLWEKAVERSKGWFDD